MNVVYELSGGYELQPVLGCINKVGHIIQGIHNLSFSDVIRYEVSLGCLSCLRNEGEMGTVCKGKSMYTLADIHIKPMQNNSKDHLLVSFGYLHTKHQK